MEFKTICPICERVNEMTRESFYMKVDNKQVEVVDSPVVDGLEACELDRQFI